MNNQKIKMYASLAWTNLEDESGNNLEHYARVINNLVEDINLDGNYENLDVTLKVIDDLDFMLKNIKAGLRKALREMEGIE